MRRYDLYLHTANVNSKSTLFQDLLKIEKEPSNFLSCVDVLQYLSRFTCNVCQRICGKVSRFGRNLFPEPLNVIIHSLILSHLFHQFVLVFVVVADGDVPEAINAL